MLRQVSKSSKRKQKRGVLFPWPVRAFGKIFYAIDKNIVALDMNTGDVVWTMESGNEFFPALEISGSTIIAGHGKQFVFRKDKTPYVFALSCDTGEVIWKYPLPAELKSHMSVDDESIFLVGRSFKNDNVILDQLVYIDTRTGKEQGQLFCKR